MIPYSREKVRDLADAFFVGKKAAGRGELEPRGPVSDSTLELRSAFSKHRQPAETKQKHRRRLRDRIGVNYRFGGYGKRHAAVIEMAIGV